MIEAEWIACESLLPDEGVIVETRISDHHGVRNVQPLKRMGRLWFTPDGDTPGGEMYVYYVPTHWRPCQ